MTFTIMHRGGEMEDGDAALVPDVLDSLLAELDEPRDDEHPDVAISHDDTAWCLSAFQTGLLVWENVEDDDPRTRHMTDVPRAAVRRAMLMVAEGRLADVEKLAWQPGYGPASVTPPS